MALHQSHTLMAVAAGYRLIILSPFHHSMQVQSIDHETLSSAYTVFREQQHHLERFSGAKQEECPVCCGGAHLHCAHADGNLKLDVLDLDQKNYRSRYEKVAGSLAVPDRLVCQFFVGSELCMYVRCNGRGGGSPGTCTPSLSLLQVVTNRRSISVCVYFAA